VTDEERLEGVLGAVTAAMVGEGDDLVVDLEALEKGLTAAGISCTSTTNRGALAAELTVVRDEWRTQNVRWRHTTGAEQDAVNDILIRLKQREDEITALLWPAR
jgi:hypothetical protein